MGAMPQKGEARAAHGVYRSVVHSLKFNGLMWLAPAHTDPSRGIHVALSHYEVCLDPQPTSYWVAPGLRGDESNDAHATVRLTFSTRP